MNTYARPQNTMAKILDHLGIEYKVGIAETFKENQTARKLLSEAIKSKKGYVSEPLKKETVTE